MVAIVAALAAAVLALDALEWGSDSGPVLGVFSAVPAALNAGLLRWLTARSPRVARTAPGVALGVLGLATWAVALGIAFNTQSSYSSDTGGSATVWVISGALGALGALVAVAVAVAVASRALLPRRVRTAGWAVGALLVALLWAWFGIARFIDNNAVLTF